MAARRNAQTVAEETPVEVSPVVTTADLGKPAAEAPAGYTLVEGTDGKTATVPNSIVAALVDSGYKVK